MPTLPANAPCWRRPCAWAAAAAAWGHRLARAGARGGPESEHLLSAFPRYRRSWPDHDPRHLYPAAPAAAPASPRGRDPCGAWCQAADDTVRPGPGKGRRVCRETVRLFFDFVESNPAAFIVGVRELHGASPVLRGALRQIMDEFAEDMSEDIIEFRLLPAVSEATIRRLSSLIGRQLFQLSLDYIGQPERRRGNLRPGRGTDTAVVHRRRGPADDGRFVGRRGVRPA